MGRRNPIDMIGIRYYNGIILKEKILKPVLFVSQRVKSKSSGDVFSIGKSPFPCQRTAIQ